LVTERVPMFGVALDGPFGSHDGLDDSGHRHFRCRAKHGILIETSKVQIVDGAGPCVIRLRTESNLMSVQLDLSSLLPSGKVVYHTEGHTYVLHVSLLGGLVPLPRQID